MGRITKVGVYSIGILIHIEPPWLYRRRGMVGAMKPKSMLMSLKGWYVVNLMFMTMVLQCAHIQTCRYVQTRQLTEKVDVYAFGVVLLEFISGKEPLITNENFVLVEWVSSLGSGHFAYEHVGLIFRFLSRQPIMNRHKHIYQN